MKNILSMLMILGLFTGIGSCVDPYAPPLLDQDHNYLVVEGYINSGAPSIIRLSRTSGLNENNGLTRETNASVTIEGKTGFAANLEEGLAGTYTGSPVDLDPADEYRLRILTSSGMEYLSEYLTLIVTPAIDSVSWKLKENGVQVYVNTHDPLNNSRYYKWEFEETWEFNAPFLTYLAWQNDGIVELEDHPPVNCWQYANSGSILVGSSAKLSQDIISQQPLTIIPNRAVKLSSKYSILVRQQAISKRAFEYLQQMKRNSEETGSFFDPQPTEVRGNIYSVSNPNEPVIGFLSAGTVVEKRKFISRAEVGRWGYDPDCPYIEVEPDEYMQYFTGEYVPISVDMRGLAYATYRRCTDCSMQASPQKPLYWE